MNKKRIVDFLLRSLLLILFGVLLIALYLDQILPGPHDDGAITSTKSFASSLGTTLDAFQLDVGRYPSTSEGLSALVQRLDSVSKDRWHGPYQRVILKDGWKRDFLYFCPPKAQDAQTSYQLISLGQDGKLGTQDDIIFPDE